MKEGLSEAVIAGLEESLAGTKDTGGGGQGAGGPLWSLGSQKRRPCAVGI